MAQVGMNSKLEITLMLDGGKNKSMTIDSPKANISKADVENFVNSFAGTDKMIFTTGLKDAQGVSITKKAMALKKARVKATNYKDLT